MERAILSYLFGRLQRCVGRISFVQIGANDGKTNDPIHETVRAQGWRGILVEPVDYLFERLVRNYAGCPDLHFAKCVVDAEPGEKTFYWIPEWDSPPGTMHDQLSSLKRDVIMTHEQHIPELERMLVETRVACRTVRQLVEEYGFDEAHALFVDTEGSDYDILRSVDFGGLGVRLVYYENSHFDAQTVRAAQELLVGQGFRTLELDDNTVAVRPDMVEEDEWRLMEEGYAAHVAMKGEYTRILQMLSQTGTFSVMPGAQGLNIRRIGEA